MKIAKLIIKGILFYVTIAIIVFFICSIDSIYNNDYLLVALMIIAILISACYIFITKEEIDIILFTKHFEEFEDI